jgi:hypothetical protein
MFIILMLFIQVSLRANKEQMRETYPQIWQLLKDEDLLFLEAKENNVFIIENKTLLPYSLSQNQK